APSNAGSLLALLAYPFLLERILTLRQQSLAWTVGYALLIGLAALCALALWRAPRPAVKGKAAPAAPEPLPRARKLRWQLLPFVPASLMLSVTTYLTTDIAAIPLLWVLPLALYLLTFVLAFAPRPLLPRALLARWMPLVVLLVVLTLLSEATELKGVG